MFNTSSVLMFIVVFLLLFWWINRPRHLPPGPFHWPLLGSFLTFTWHAYRTGLEPHELLTYLSQKYGNIYCLNTFGSYVIVISDYQLLKEALNNPKINDRFANKLRIKIFGLNRVAYEDYQFYRRFAMNTFRYFGAGKQSFENKVSAESQLLRLEISKLQGESTELDLILNNATANVLCAVIYGQRYEYDDDQFKSLMHLIERFVKALGAGGSENTLPILALLFTSKTQREIDALQQPMREFLSKIIEDHRKDFDGEHINDFLDAYLREQRSHGESIEDEHSFVHDDNITGHLLTLFVAGAHTTSSVILWGILYMIINPGIQSRVQSELDSVVGRSRFPRITDKINLPYTRAVIQEIYRMSSPVPLSLLHIASEDTTIGPYYVPKGTTVVPNIWGIHQDPGHWRDLHDFRPERFIDSGDKVSQVIPFGVGRRSCPGEALAQAMVFIFFTHLLHQFTFVVPNGSSQPSLKGVLGATYSPSAFLTCAFERGLD